MAYIDFISRIHQGTSRNYLQRVTDYDKAACAEVSGKFGEEYFDGDRRFGYGGYRYDGRWRKFAELVIAHYGLKPGDKILDVGCGKGFLVKDLMETLPGLQAYGLDVSEYAIRQGMPEVKDRLRVGTAAELPYGDQEFDFIFSINTLHNLSLIDLFRGLREIERVGKGSAKYIVVDGYRNEREKVNLLYWQLTCKCFYRPEEWEWIFQQTGYRGDYGCVFFE
jgi:protein-L-isoaspartate(D-aspartate) O-methyltransferase